MKHYSVLKEEAIQYLNLRSDSVIVDATLGYAGHASEILKQIPNGYLYAFDADLEAIDYSTQKLSEIGNNFEIIHANFQEMKEELLKRGIIKVDGILFDLGVSSPQIDSQSRGFSFMRDENLDMRMDQTKSFTAKDLVNNYSFEQLRDIFFQYGEEKKSVFIAKEIVEMRKHKSIDSTLELVQIIQKAVGANYFYKTHPERNIFQAIRIEVNQELKVLENVLPDAIHLLKLQGRLCVITFHSLEDRLVKKIFKKYSELDEHVKGLPEIPFRYLPEVQLILKKPILPSDQELNQNTRSRSAKLRVIERIKENDKEEK